MVLQKSTLKDEKQTTDWEEVFPSNQPSRGPESQLHTGLSQFRSKNKHTTQSGKGRKVMKRHFTEEDTQRANKHMTRCFA